MKPTHLSHAARLGRVNHFSRGAFTLTELLVVMGLIALLGVLTAAGYRTIAKDAKLSSGKNTVMAVLDNARGLAMKNNRMVMVVFRPRMDGPKSMYVEAVTAKWSGESFVLPPGTLVVDRFVPIENVPPRALPAGIKVAGPRYGETLGTGPVPSYDDYWCTQVQLTAIDPVFPFGGNSERPGAIVAVMYGADGTLMTRNPQSAADRAYVDFNNDHLLRMRTGANNVTDYTCVGGVNANYPPSGYFDQTFEDDEPFVSAVPYLAVYDDDKVRDLRAKNWTVQTDYEAELSGPTGYINQSADRIHFNRYTGVAMK